MYFFFVATLRVENILGQWFAPWTWMMTPTLTSSSYLLLCMWKTTEREEFMLAPCLVWWMFWLFLRTILSFLSQSLWFSLRSLQDVRFQADVVLRGSASNLGRFGSSLAVLPDLNADGFNDLAVGAPLENNGQGSIYIFHGKGKGRISLTYSQVSKILIPSH